MVDINMSMLKVYKKNKQYNVVISSKCQGLCLRSNDEGKSTRFIKIFAKTSPVDELSDFSKDDEKC